MTIPAIVLAAGASRRLGRPKQLLELEGEALLGRAIRMARESGADPVLVVLGSSADTIGNSVPLEQAVVVLNCEWAEGISSSIRAGIRVAESCAPEAPAVILMTCDQPRLSTGHLRLLIERFVESDGLAVVASTYDGARGTPAVLARSVFPRLGSLQGDKGARGILADPHLDVIEVPFEGGQIDIDEPADLSHVD